MLKGTWRPDEWGRGRYLSIPNLQEPTGDSVFLARVARKIPCLPARVSMGGSETDAARERSETRRGRARDATERAKRFVEHGWGTRPKTLTRAALKARGDARAPPLTWADARHSARTLPAPSQHPAPAKTGRFGQKRSGFLGESANQRPGGTAQAPATSPALPVLRLVCLSPRTRLHPQLPPCGAVRHCL